jgi:redox-sensitive bicupin YhaK (pirin superfamily)
MPTDLSRRQLLALGGLPLGWLVGCKSSEPARAAVPEERAVKLVVPATPTLEGAGVHLRRSLGSRALSMLDPFLLLDEIKSSDPAEFAKGFPTHPHRGFETVTYMLGGKMEHADSLGNRGLLEGGSAQWMTAGSGIIHSEMPQRDSSSFWGFQLWVNLPASSKMTRPRYQDIAPSRIPEVSVSGAKTRVVAGVAAGARGPVEGIVTAPEFLDVTLSGSPFTRELPKGHTAFVYVLSGSLGVGRERQPASEGELCVLGPGSTLTVTGDSGGRFLLLAARPLGEPVARRGPFVMNTDAEIQQAISDYQNGTLVRS